MRYFTRTIVGVCSFALVACSTHPIPQGIPAPATIRIVNAIRCEMRQALIDQVIMVLETSGDPNSARQAAKLKDDNEHILDLEPEDIDPISNAMITRFLDASIAYEFEFDITEENNKSGKVGFTFPFSNGSLKVGGSSAANFKRRGKRTFNVTDKFRIYQTLRCGALMEGYASNLLYPITGEIGLYESVDTFIKATYLDLPPLTLRFEMTVDEIVNYKSDFTGTFTDEITFTTDLSVGNTIDLSIDPVRERLKLTSANGETKHSRVDAHKVVIVYSQPVQAPPKKAAPAKRKITRTGKSVFEQKIYTPPEIEAAKDEAVRELRRRRNIELLGDEISR